MADAAFILVNFVPIMARPVLAWANAGLFLANPILNMARVVLFLAKAILFLAKAKETSCLLGPAGENCGCQ